MKNVSYANFLSNLIDFIQTRDLTNLENDINTLFGQESKEPIHKYEPPFFDKKSGSLLLYVFLILAVIVTGFINLYIILCVFTFFITLFDSRIRTMENTGKRWKRILFYTILPPIYYITRIKYMIQSYKYRMKLFEDNKVDPNSTLELPDEFLHKQEWE